MYAGCRRCSGSPSKSGPQVGPASSSVCLFVGVCMSAARSCLVWCLRLSGGAAQREPPALRSLGRRLLFILSDASVSTHPHTPSWYLQRDDLPSPFHYSSVAQYIGWASKIRRLLTWKHRTADRLIGFLIIRQAAASCFSPHFRGRTHRSSSSDDGPTRRRTVFELRSSCRLRLQRHQRHLRTIRRGLSSLPQLMVRMPAS